MLVLCFAVLGALSSVLGHVTLRYPPPLLANDFLDSVRTTDICGLAPTAANEIWRLPQESSAVTNLTAGSDLTVRWDLHYAHQGGVVFELRYENETIFHMWDSMWGDGASTCDVDGTMTTLNITLPNTTCTNCILRMKRKALEWGATYEFKSCARVNVLAAGDACNGCSGHGACNQGSCQCESTPEAGFFYGDHCEYENECEEDAHCGDHGLCVDVGDVSGPAKQCFCENGWFGTMEASSTGLERRLCNTASQLSLDASSVASFSDGYDRSMSSPTSQFEMHWRIDGNVLEVAMKGDTTSWIAAGWRAIDSGDAAPSGGASAAEGEAGAEGEAEGASEAEGEAESERRLLQSSHGLKARLPMVESEAGSAATSFRSRRAVLSTRALSEAEGEGEGAAEGEGETPPAGGAAAVDVGPTCTVDASVQLRPAALDVGVVVTADEAAAMDAPAPPAEGEGEGEAEGEAGAEAEAEAPSAARRSLASTHLPVVESEAVPQRRVRSRRAVLSARSLSEAEGEGEGAGEAEGDGESEGGAEAEDAGAAAADGVNTATSGECAGNVLTPGTAHAMINQDVVFAAARVVEGTQYVRVLDMFTPSRSKPLPDHKFCTNGNACGSDDILDAVGVEVDGTTYVKFRRALNTEDQSFADYCISEDQLFTVIYAFGVLTADATHAPGSSLEILPAAQLSNQDFYKEDELKFHGGGINDRGYEGRGTLGAQVNFIAEEEADGCPPSTEDGFDCRIQVFPDDSVAVHFKRFAAGDTAANIALEYASETGWFAMGWNRDSPTAMIGATAIVVPEGDDVQLYTLGGKSANLVTPLGSGVTTAAGRRLNQAGTDFEITNVAVQRGGGRTLLTFDRAYDADFTGDATQQVIVAKGDTPAITAHSATDRTPLSFALTGDATDSPSGGDVTTLWFVHGWLMGLGWGVLLPLGVIIANTMRHHGPIWFQLHRAIQWTGLILTTAGVAIAWSQFGLGPSSPHFMIGTIVMIIGWLQPLNALLRPHAPGAGEEKSSTRFYWELLHIYAGRSALILGIVNVFIGIKILSVYGIISQPKWMGIYGAALGVLVAAWAALFYMKLQADKEKEKGEEPLTSEPK